MAKRVENGLGNSLKSSWEITGRPGFLYRIPGKWDGAAVTVPCVHSPSRAFPCLTGGSRRDPRPKRVFPRHLSL